LSKFHVAITTLISTLLHLLPSGNDSFFLFLTVRVDL
jgi:hypothetical protein